MVQLSHLHMTPGETIALTIWTFVVKIVSWLLNTLLRFGMTFLSKRKCVLIWWLQSTSIVILEPKKIKPVTIFIFSPIYLPWNDRIRCQDLSFWMLSFKPASSLSSFTFIKRLFSSSLLSAIRVVSLACLRLAIFLPEILIPTGA